MRKWYSEIPRVSCCSQFNKALLQYATNDKGHQCVALMPLDIENMVGTAWSGLAKGTLLFLVLGERGWMKGYGHVTALGNVDQLFLAHVQLRNETYGLKPTTCYKLTPAFHLLNRSYPLA